MALVRQFESGHGRGAKAQVQGGDLVTDDAGVIGAGPVPRPRPRPARTRAAVRAGLNHGWIELSHCFTMVEDAFEILPLALISVVLLLATGSKHVQIPGTHFPIGSTILAGMVGVNVGLNGITSLGMQLTAEARGRHAAAREGDAERGARLPDREDRRRVRHHHVHRDKPADRRAGPRSAGLRSAVP